MLFIPEIYVIPTFLLPATNLGSVYSCLWPCHFACSSWFSSQISQLLQLLMAKTAYGIRTLIKPRQFFSRWALQSLYFASIHSHFTYGIVAWVIRILLTFHTSNTSRTMPCEKSQKAYSISTLPYLVQTTCRQFAHSSNIELLYCCSNCSLINFLYTLLSYVVSPIQTQPNLLRTTIICLL